MDELGFDVGVDGAGAGVGVLAGVDFFDSASDSLAFLVLGASVSSTLRFFSLLFSTLFSTFFTGSGVFSDSSLSSSPALGSSPSMPPHSSSSSSTAPIERPSHLPPGPAPSSQDQIGRLILELVLMLRLWMLSQPPRIRFATSGRAVVRFARV